MTTDTQPRVVNIITQHNTQQKARRQNLYNSPRRHAFVIFLLCLMYRSVKVHASKKHQTRDSGMGR